MNRLLALAIPLSVIVQSAFSQNATDASSPLNSTTTYAHNEPAFGKKEEPVWVDTELIAPNIIVKQIDRWSNLTS